MQAIQVARQSAQQTLALYRPSALYTYTFSHPWAVVFRPIVSAAASKAGDGGFIDGNNYVVQQLKRLSADVKEEVAKLDDAVLALAADPHNPGRLTDVQNLESRLASMNEMHKSLVAQLAGGPTAGVSGAEPKVITLKLPGGKVVPKTFTSQQALDRYLDRRGYTGLLPEGGGEEDEVDAWNLLIPGTTYELCTKELLEEKVRIVKQELLHLTKRREEEFGIALCAIAAEAEGVDLSAASLIPDARIQVVDGVESEVDAVVKVETSSGPLLYVGSHKTFCDGKSDVNDADASAKSTFKWAQTAQAPTSVRGVIGAKAAFMAESLGPKGKTVVPRQCNTLDVLLVQRSDGAIIKA